MKCLDIRLSSTDNLFRDSAATFQSLLKVLRQKREEQTGMASEIEKNKLVTAPHEYLSIDSVLY